MNFKALNSSLLCCRAIVKDILGMQRHIFYLFFFATGRSLNERGHQSLMTLFLFLQHHSASRGMTDLLSHSEESVDGPVRLSMALIGCSEPGKELKWAISSRKLNTPDSGSDTLLPPLFIMDNAAINISDCTCSLSTRHQRLST